MSTNSFEGSVVDERLSALRDSIVRVFPSIPFEGQVTYHDGAWLPELTEKNAIHDDDKFLYEALSGRKWSDVSRDFVYAMPGEFVLLTDEALIAFLAAWLVHSLENFDGRNEVREMFVYAFSPIGTTRDSRVKRLRALNFDQRALVRSLLVEFGQRERSDFIRRHAASAVELIDSFDLSPPKSRH
jgi:hypothetical protein